MVKYIVLDFWYKSEVILMSLKLNTKYLDAFVNKDELSGIKPQVETAAKTLHDKSGLGNDFLGWLNLPTDYDKNEFSRIKAAAKNML